MKALHVLVAGGAALLLFGVLKKKASAAPGTTLNQPVQTFATKNQVGCLQYTLNRRYGLALPETGVYDDATKVAVQRVQGELGLPATGDIDLPLLTKIGGCGSMETFYRCVQKALNATKRPDGTAYEKVDEDGQLSSPLVRALRQFQADYNLPVTGRLDLLTLNAVQC